MPVTVEVEGLKELDEALVQLKRATARRVLRKVLVKAGEPIRDAMAQLAPRSGRPGINLAASIAVSLKPPHDHVTGRDVYGQVLRDGGSYDEARQAARDFNRNATFAEAWVGPDRRRYAHMQEFGTERHGPQPYARPGFEQQKMTALGIFKSELWAEISKAAARARKRAAKAAAAGN